MKILCIGHAAYDITIPLDEFPKENTKNRVPSVVECGGGPACNASYMLAKWGMDATFLGVLGDDIYGHKIEEELKSVGVDTRYLEYTNEFPTTTSYIIANKSKGSRTVFTYRPKKMRMKEVEVDFTPDILFYDGQEEELTKYYIEKYPNAIKIMDAGRPEEEIIELAKMADYVVCSKVFAETVTGISLNYEENHTLIALFQKMEATFPGKVVVTLESKGCLYKNKGKILLMPSYKVVSKDSTGAGDIFHGAFTYGIAKGFDYETVIRVSNTAGALSVRNIGGRYSIPEKEEMKEIVHDFF